jgi:hypothetical protein
MDTVYALREKQANSFLHLIGTYDQQIKEVLFEMFTVRSLILSEEISLEEFKR